MTKARKRKKSKTVIRLPDSIRTRLRELRREGWTIGELSEEFGPSKSVIWEAVKNVEVAEPQPEQDETVDSNEAQATQASTSDNEDSSDRTVKIPTSIHIKESSLKLLESAAALSGRTLDEAIEDAAKTIRGEKQNRAENVESDDDYIAGVRELHQCARACFSFGDWKGGKHYLDTAEAELRKIGRDMGFEQGVQEVLVMPPIVREQESTIERGMREVRDAYLEGFRLRVTIKAMRGEELTDDELRLAIPDEWARKHEEQERRNKREHMRTVLMLVVNMIEHDTTSDRDIEYTVKTLSKAGILTTASYIRGIIERFDATRTPDEARALGRQLLGA